MKYFYLNNLREFIGKSSLATKLIRPLYHCTLKKWKKQTEKKKFKENAHNVLESFVKCMDDNNLYYTLAFGSLLGAVREKGFIKHDMDIDVFMWAEDYNPSIVACLESSGFKLEYEFIVKGGVLGREQTFVKNDIGIDIFYIYPPINELPYCCDFIMVNDCTSFESQIKKHGGVACRRIELPFKKGRKLTKFEDLEVYIPTNSDELLKFRYGDDYMIPNPKWTPGKTNKYIIHWNGILGKYQAY